MVLIDFLGRHCLDKFELRIFNHSSLVLLFENFADHTLTVHDVLLGIGSTSTSSHYAFFFTAFEYMDSHNGSTSSDLGMTTYGK